MRERIAIAMKGVGMGMAEVVPGVSGGTIAFVTGIYERLLQSITAVGPGLVDTFRRGGVRAVWKEVQGAFLINLIVGMAVGLVIGVFAISYLIQAYPPVVWAFFFGLILASAGYIGRMVQPWSLVEVISMFSGCAIALAIVLGTPSQGSTSPIYVFASGAIAISALLLPGVSGSFILLLMGMYSYVIPSVKDLLSGDLAALPVVATFGLGCFTGLVSFSRLLKFLFERYPQPTLGLLTGFMLGSLYKLWPWRVVTEYARDINNTIIVDDEGVRKILKEAPVMAARYSDEVGPAYASGVVIAVIAGIVLIYALSRLEGQTGQAL